MVALQDINIRSRQSSDTDPEEIKFVAVWNEIEIEWNGEGEKVVDGGRFNLIGTKRLVTDKITANLNPVSD